MVLRQRPGQGLVAGRPWQAGQAAMRPTAARQAGEGSTCANTRYIRALSRGQKSPVFAPKLAITAERQTQH